MRQSEEHYVIFGKYRLKRKLGAGGMAEVFLAEAGGPCGFEKDVALKVLHSDLADDDGFIQSFINEARLGGRLNHPNIVQALELGWEREHYYLAMEYVDGITLGALLRQRRREGMPLPMFVILDVACQVSKGLAYAHSARDSRGQPLRMVHRDLKPENLLLSRHGVVKITDFGVARADSNLQKTLTMGALKGTIGYMSPEQASCKELDHRSDLFSLGAILFEMFTLEKLYPFSRTRERLKRVRIGDVKDRLDMLMPFPPALSDLVRRLLRPEPDARPQSAEEVQQILRAARTVVPESQLDTAMIVGRAIQMMETAGTDLPESESGSDSDGRDIPRTIGPVKERQQGFVNKDRSAGVDDSGGEDGSGDGDGSVGSAIEHPPPESVRRDDGSGDGSVGAEDPGSGYPPGFATLATSRVLARGKGAGVCELAGKVSGRPDSDAEQQITVVWRREQGTGSQPVEPPADESTGLLESIESMNGGSAGFEESSRNEIRGSAPITEPTLRISLDGSEQTLAPEPVPTVIISSRAVFAHRREPTWQDGVDHPGLHQDVPREERPSSGDDAPTVVEPVGRNKWQNDMSRTVKLVVNSPMARATPASDEDRLVPPRPGTLAGARNEVAEDVAGHPGWARDGSDTYAPALGIPEDQLETAIGRVAPEAETSSRVSLEGAPESAARSSPSSAGEMLLRDRCMEEGGLLGQLRRAWRAWVGGRPE